jgi:hypothetical protein
MDVVVRHDIGVKRVSLAVEVAKVRNDEVALFVRKIGQPRFEARRREVECSVSSNTGKPMAIEIEIHNAVSIHVRFRPGQPERLWSNKRNEHILRLWALLSRHGGRDARPTLPGFQGTY